MKRPPGVIDSISVSSITLKYLVPFIILLGCGDQGHVPHDGPVDSATLVADDGAGGSLSTVAFADALVGQSSTITVTLVNRGTVDTGPIALDLSGLQQAEFTIDSANSTCNGASLLASGQCVIALRFRPLAAGPRTATLAFTSSSGVSGSVVLSGASSVPDLHFVPAALDVPAMQAGTTTSRVVELRNDGSTEVTFQELRVTGAGFGRTNSTCSGSLAPHTSCDLSISIAPATTGVVTGALQVASNQGTFTAPLQVTGARGLAVEKAGNGAGRVIAADVDIDCGSVCSALVTTAVTLTATPDPGSALVGWSIAECGVSSTCVVPLDVFAAKVTATFAHTGSGTLTVAFAGTSSGEVLIHGPDPSPVTCYSTCTLPVVPGETYTFDVSTWSQFSETSGPGVTCTPDSPRRSCNWLAVAGASTIAVTFDKRPGERYTRFLPGPPSIAELDGDDNLIVAAGNQLIKLSPLGATLWSMPFVADALDTGPQNTIYVVGTHNSDTGLFKLDASGAVLWNVQIPTGYNARVGVTKFATTLAVANGGAVVSIGGTGIMRWDSAGHVTWTQPLGFTTVGGVAIQPDGTVVVGRASEFAGQIHNVVGERFSSAAGTQLTPDVGIIGREWTGDLEVDSAGNVAMHNTSGFRTTHFTWRTHEDEVSDSVDLDRVTGTCVIGATQAVYVYNRSNDLGYHLARMAADGTSLEATTVERFDVFGVQFLNDLTCSRKTNAYVLAGEYRGFAQAVDQTTGYVQFIVP